MSIPIVEKSIVFVLRMGKFVATNVGVQLAEIRNNVKGVLHYKRKKVWFVTVKKANVPKSIVNVMPMESDVGKVVTVRTVRTFDNRM